MCEYDVALFCYTSTHEQIVFKRLRMCIPCHIIGMIDPEISYTFHMNGGSCEQFVSKLKHSYSEYP